MASTENIYKGGGYGFDPAYGMGENYGETFMGFEYRTPASNIGFTSDGRTINQLKAVSDKLSSGAKTIEVQGTFPQVLDAIPEQQFKEINRLKKLTGVDLTFHGPLVEPTGFNPQSREVKEGDRIRAEQHMINAIRRSHELDPKGNMVVTFHSSNGLPDPEARFINDNGKEEIKEFWVVNETTGGFGNVAPEINHLKEEVERDNPKKFLEKVNKDRWIQQLESINFNINRGTRELREIDSIIERATNGELKDSKPILQLASKIGTPEGDKIEKELGKYFNKGFLKDFIDKVTFSDLEVRQAYQQFQGVYNEAYDSVNRNNNTEDKKKLDVFREGLKQKFGNKFEKLEKTENVDDLAEELQSGIRMLRGLKQEPQIFTPMRDWAIDKSSTSFANVALDSYKKFKNTAPIISIENPPFGSGLARAEDLKRIVKKSREKFVENAVDNLGLSKKEAEKQAEKLIGVTWDVGHINMLRGHGYTKKDVIKETGIVAPYVKHVHLSDNFGLEHTELPMGMGNVPLKKELELIHKYNKKVKHIVETGGLWFEHMKVTPIRETVSALGSPLYSTGQGPYWNQVAHGSGGYYSGQGTINPQVHHSLYGSGFSNLPVELGGQIQGQSRASGAPIGQ